MEYQNRADHRLDIHVGYKSKYLEAIIIMTYMRYKCDSHALKAASMDPPKDPYLHNLIFL